MLKAKSQKATQKSPPILTKIKKINEKRFGISKPFFYLCTMKQEYLNTITHTATGLAVKNLRWLPVDNIITGLVECPILNKTISGQWRSSGVPTNRIKGRAELKLEINLEMSI